MIEFQAIVAGGSLTSVVLAILHLLLWEARPNMKLVPRYTIGVAVINLGLTVTGWLLGVWIIPIAAWGVAGMGGAVVGALHLWREAKAQRRSANLVQRAITVLSQGGSDAGRPPRGPDDRGA